jgi:hypothetical protein
MDNVQVGDQVTWRADGWDSDLLTGTVAEVLEHPTRAVVEVSDNPTLRVAIIDAERLLPADDEMIALAVEADEWHQERLDVIYSGVPF